MRPKLYVGGTFDLLHGGHILLLDLAAELGEVIVSLNTDEFTERYKGKPPVQPLAERLLIMRAIRYVSQVVVNVGDEDSKPAILASNATFIVHGTDWMGEALYKQMGLTREWLDDLGIEFIYFDKTAQSSTELKRRIREPS